MTVPISQCVGMFALLSRVGLMTAKPQKGNVLSGFTSWRPETLQVSWVLGGSGFLTPGDTASMSPRTRRALRSWALGCLGLCPF